MADRPSQPFVDGYLAYLLARASHLISGEFHRQVAASGLSIPEWRVLATLADREECTIGTLAEITLTKQPTLTKLIDRMAADGLVARRPGLEDRRHALISITARGREVVLPLLAEAAQHEQAVLEDFGPQQGALLKETLRKLIALHTQR
ncbi:MarR family winged helix-turn-helix transcriptional regulator [Cupriavidus sp. IDO]|uniref:MarR family winged helix-turn-helix transcriptional regulator n=1 Tax=Cupriavidus sp. IDO TaxID=1539142 RepID=UPI0005794713|nr:MarR family transcriptional regulator [Cupriavidus sp. IDO]KWR78672.1 MarR family transcriptional regulator [Cupriavidus sp. IDO]